MTRTALTANADVTSQSHAPAQLQRACACGAAKGVEDNCPTCAAKARMGVQPKLTVNKPGDRFEQEADRIADRVVSTGLVAPAAASGPMVQRDAAQEEEDVQMKPAGLQRLAEEEDEVQMKSGSLQRMEGEEEDEMQMKSAGPGHTNTSIAQAAVAVAGGGTPLSRAERGFFEPRLGRDLSNVRLHSDTRAGAAARGINARAYTLKNHIAFAPGTLDFSSTEGRRLMAHELVHTIQQSGGGNQLINRAPSAAPATTSSGPASASTAPSTSTPPCDAAICPCDSDQTKTIAMGWSIALSAMREVIGKIADGPEDRSKFRVKRAYKKVFGAHGDVDGGLSDARDNLLAGAAFLAKQKPNAGIYCDPDPNRCSGNAYHEPRSKQVGGVQQGTARSATGVPTKQQTVDQSIIAICFGTSDQQELASDPNRVASLLLHESMHNVFQPGTIDIYVNSGAFGMISGRRNKKTGVALKNPDSYVSFVETTLGSGLSDFSFGMESGGAVDEIGGELSMGFQIGSKAANMAFRMAQQTIREASSTLGPALRESRLRWAGYPAATAELGEDLVKRGNQSTLADPVGLQGQDLYNYFVTRINVLENIQFDLDSAFALSKGARIDKTRQKAAEKKPGLLPIIIADPKSFKKLPENQQVLAIVRQILADPTLNSLPPQMPEIAVTLSLHFGVLQKGAT